MALTLVLRALGLGDLLTAVPALRAIRAARPIDRIVLAAPLWQRPLVELIGGVDTVLDCHGLREVAAVPWTEVSSAPPALAVNLHGRGPESHDSLLALRPQRLVAFANAAAGVATGPQWRADEHEVHRWCRLVSTELGPADPSDLLLEPPGIQPSVHGAVVIHAGAAAGSRRWPARRFAAVARTLAAQGHHVVVTGSEQEHRLARAVAQEAGLPESCVVAGTTSVLELAALIAASSATISGDTGVAHLATAFACPSVVLLGPVSPALWGPPAGEPRHEAIWHGPSSGLRDGVDSALLEISVDEVLAAFARVTQSGWS